MELLRTLLFVPANRPNMLEKALTLEADAYLPDLEDAVPIAEKPAARAALGSGGWLACLAASGRPVFVRVNAAFTGETPRDLEAIVGPHLSGIVLPKAEPDAVAQADQWLAAPEQQAGPTLRPAAPPPPD